MGRNEGAGTTKTQASMAIEASEIAMFRRSTIYSTRGVLAAGFGGFLNQTQRDRLFRALRRFFAATWSIYPSVTRGALEFDNSAEARRAIKVRDRSDITNLSKLVRDDVIVPLHGEPWVYDPDNGATPDDLDIIAAPSVGNLIRRRGTPLSLFEVDRTIDTEGGATVHVAAQEWAEYLAAKSVDGSLPAGTLKFDQRVAVTTPNDKVSRFKIAGSSMRGTNLLGGAGNTDGIFSFNMPNNVGGEIGFIHFDQLTCSAGAAGAGDGIYVERGGTNAGGERTCLFTHVRVQGGENTYFNTGIKLRGRATRPLIQNVWAIGALNSDLEGSPVTIASFTTGTPGIINLPGGHGIVTGDTVLYNNGGGTTPTGLSNNSNYIASITGNECRLAVDGKNLALGTFIALSTTGSGSSHTLRAESRGTNDLRHAMTAGIDVGDVHSPEISNIYAQRCKAGILSFGSAGEGFTLDRFTITNCMVGLVLARSGLPNIYISNGHVNARDCGLFLNNLGRTFVENVDLRINSSRNYTGTPQCRVLTKNMNDFSLRGCTGENENGASDLQVFRIDSANNDPYGYASLFGFTYGTDTSRGAVRNIRFDDVSVQWADKIAYFNDGGFSLPNRNAITNIRCMQNTVITSTDAFEGMTRDNWTITFANERAVFYVQNNVNRDLDPMERGAIFEQGPNINAARTYTILSNRAGPGVAVTIIRRDAGAGVLTIAQSIGSDIGTLNAGQWLRAVYKDATTRFQLEARGNL
jgi:hypothetical protein